MSRLLVSILALGVALPACRDAEKKDEPDESETQTTGGVAGNGGSGARTNDSTVPQVGAISLETLGGKTEGTALTADACNKTGLGVLGLAIGGACSTAPMAARLMVGRDNGDHNGDGVMNCLDLAAAKAAKVDAGILLHLLCESIMQQNDEVVSLAFEDDESGGAMAIAFNDFPGDTKAAGSWTRGNAGSYPADIRVWFGNSFGSLAGHIGRALTIRDNGKVFINGQGFSPNGNPDFAATVDFSSKSDASSCAAEPGEANCHWQDIKIYAGESADTKGPPNGFHLKIFADAKANAGFFALEGKYRYTEAYATAQWGALASSCPSGELKKLRTVYFQVLQKGNQVHGKLVFRDASGAELACTMPGGVDPFALMRAGVCQNLGADAWVNCTDLNPADYAALWQGEAGFANVTASPVGAIFEGAPTSEGICTLTGCRGL